jgi:hypothetical protein
MAVSETDKLNKNISADITGARAVIFDRRWDFASNSLANNNFAGNNVARGYIELRILENPQNQQCQFSWSAGIADYVPLQYDMDVNADTYREYGLPADSKLLVDVANFRASRRQVSFDLLIELKAGTFSAPIRIFNDTVHCSVPTTNMVEEQLRSQIPNINIGQLERALASVRAIASPSN